ncbi:hypothetical protein IKZ80_02680 [bacterium]|nr:hypothetical protein [bacterium]
MNEKISARAENCGQEGGPNHGTQLWEKEENANFNKNRADGREKAKQAKQSILPINCHIIAKNNAKSEGNCRKRPGPAKREKFTENEKNTGK